MSVTDMRCDRCGNVLAGPAGLEGVGGRGAVRLVYHPGSYKLKDDSGLLCEGCASAVRDELGERTEGRCGLCGEPVEHKRSVHVFVAMDPKSWQLCPRHGAEFLNTLRTVSPKLDPETFTLAGDWT